MGCDKESVTEDLDFRAEMRYFVSEISAYAKSIDPDFIIVPQNGHELLILDESTGTFADDYIASIDGIGREDLFFGYDNDDITTPSGETEYMIEFMDLAENNGVEVLVTDYCWASWKVDSSYAWSDAKGYISFAANHRELDNIPDYPNIPHNSNLEYVTQLAEARNFLYLLNTMNYADKDAFLTDIKSSGHDVYIIDPFFSESLQLTAEDIDFLKLKPG